MFATAVTAIPDAAPASTSDTFPEIKVETRVPALVVSSSVIVVKNRFAPDSTGASFTADTLIVIVRAVGISVDPTVSGTAVVLHQT